MAEEKANRDKEAAIAKKEEERSNLQHHVGGFGSLAQMYDHDEGHVDPNFQPHAILPNTLYDFNRERISSIANNGHIGESVHRSSVEGGEPNPHKKRDFTNQTMWTYSTEGSNTNIPAEALQARKDREAKEAAAEKQAEEK